MVQRYADAIAISDGAVNPIAIANAIVRGSREITQQPGKGTNDVRKDPAIRLMVHQLAYLVGLSTGETVAEYEKWRQDCKAAIDMSSHEILALEAKSQDSR